VSAANTTDGGAQIVMTLPIAASESIVKQAAEVG
jgi:hypothetical protein